MVSPLFLVFDGPDGSGKSTQCRLLVETLRARGEQVTTVVDPGGTALGTKLRELLLFARETPIAMRAEALLFMAARAQLVAEIVRPALARGDLIVSDRYALATLVYQGHAGGLDPEALAFITNFAAAGLQPDLTFVFDVSVETAAARRKPTPDRLEARSDAYRDRVRQGFLSEAAADPTRIHVVDANRGIDDIAADVLTTVEPLLRSRSS